MADVMKWQSPTHTENFTKLVSLYCTCADHKIWW